MVSALVLKCAGWIIARGSHRGSPKTCIVLIVHATRHNGSLR
jgi:hypothetical protein